MGDRMTPIPFSQLVKWMLEEQKDYGTVFGVYRPYIASKDTTRTLFGRPLEVPAGPAAGPHTQLAQNIAAAYYSGSRFFELKTVQMLDGEDLPVSKPCIAAEDEGYNVEWSTELYVPQALDEYIKAWFLLHIMSIEYGLGRADGFQFNMSVGYDLEGIQSKKIDTFIEALKNADNTEAFISCKKYLLDNIELFSKVTEEDIANIRGDICNSVTLSTLHGCPPKEIERIAAYLIDVKGLNTFVKCNPTLLGYEYARNTMNEMGYDYISFGEFHFLDDLQYVDAVPMLKRLIAYADERNLEFGVKITNTFPVDIKQNELPGEEMYMSGRSLYPLSISLAAKLSEDFDGKLRISFSGGADYHNIKKIADCGIWPITVATTLLKPGGYQRMEQLAAELNNTAFTFTHIDVNLLKKLAESAINDRHHTKGIKPLPSRKRQESVPLLDCSTAPCEEGCPIHQDVVAYVKFVQEGNYLKALEVITEKNPLVYLTGTICPHNCMNKCTRNFYEEPVQIRNMKLIAAKGGYDAFMANMKESQILYQKRTAVIGGGPAGLAAAYFLRKKGMPVTIFEQKNTLGGVPAHIIPEFRISAESVQMDVDFVLSLGIEVKLQKRIDSIHELKEEGFDYIILAVGAGEAGVLNLTAGTAQNALDFLAEFKKTNGKLTLGDHVVVIGGGNTAMDTARAAMRCKGTKQVSLIYRRTKRYMPADEEELILAIEDGVTFRELLSPIRYEDGKLLCSVMKLSELDASLRRSVVDTGETVIIPADAVIAAIGEQVSSSYYSENGIRLTDRGLASVCNDTLETAEEGIYVIGDGLNGPATVVEAIRDASKAANAILNNCDQNEYDCGEDAGDIYQRRGIIIDSSEGEKEGNRCLNCSAICENCAEVCPNRANTVLDVPGTNGHQILHIDYMCNECGNCRSFCPYDSAPYLDKFTLFANETDMENSKNNGFTVLNAELAVCSVRYLGDMYRYQKGADTRLPEGICKMMDVVCHNYNYLLM